MLHAEPTIERIYPYSQSAEMRTQWNAMTAVLQEVIRVDRRRVQVLDPAQTQIP